MTLTEWLDNGLRDYQYNRKMSGLWVIVLLILIVFIEAILIKRFLRSLPEKNYTGLYRSALFGELFYVGWVVLVALIIAVSNPTHIFSSPYTVLSGDEVVEYFQDKLTGELKLLKNRGEFVSASELLHRMTRQGNVMTPSLWAERRSLSKLAFAVDSLSFGNVAVREALEQEQPDDTVAAGFPAQYLLYIEALAKSDEMEVYNHCYYDPWNYQTPKSVSRFQAVVEFCQTQP